MSQLHRGFGGIHAGAVLLHGVLRVADLYAHLMYDLLKAHLGLAVFQFGANLHRLRGGVTQRDVETDPHSLVGRGRVDELIEGPTVACTGRDWDQRLARRGRGGIWSRAKTRALLGQRLVRAQIRWILRPAQTRAAVVGIQIERRQQGTAYTLVAPFTTVHAYTAFDQSAP